MLVSYSKVLCVAAPFINVYLIGCLHFIRKVSALRRQSAHTSFAKCLHFVRKVFALGLRRVYAWPVKQVREAAEAELPAAQDFLV